MKPDKSEYCEVTAYLSGERNNIRYTYRNTDNTPITRIVCTNVTMCRFRLHKGVTLTIEDFQETMFPQTRRITLTSNRYTYP